MLDTTFPRFVGDVGNPATWPFDVRYLVIDGAVPTRMVTPAPDPGMLEPFREGAQQLEAEGAWAITTSCGFLAAYQRELAAAVSVPVLTSALLQVPLAARLIGPGQAVGVLTPRPHLTQAHFAGAGWSSRELPVRIGSLAEDAAFATVYVDDPADAAEVDPDLLRDEVVAATVELCDTHPEIGVLVMECTNFVPFSQEVRRATGLPVYDLYTLIMQAHGAVAGTEIFRE